MARIAVLIEDDFEDSEYRRPVDALARLGHEVVVAGPDIDATYIGKRGDESAMPDRAISELDPSTFDAVVLPGGYAPDKLRTDDEAVSFVREMAATGRTVAAVCHAGSLLIDAGVADGRRLTSWPSIRVDLVNAGAEWVDEEVVEDGNLITSRKPDDLDAFTGAISRHLSNGAGRP